MPARRLARKYCSHGNHVAEQQTLVFHLARSTLVAGVWETYLYFETGCVHLEATTFHICSLSNRSNKHVADRPPLIHVVSNTQDDTEVG